MTELILKENLILCGTKHVKLYIHKVNNGFGILFLNLDVYMPKNTAKGAGHLLGAPPTQLFGHFINPSIHSVILSANIY